MRLFRRGAIWYAVYYSPTGKRIKQSTKCTDKRAAEARLRQLERDTQGAARLPRDAAPFGVDHAIDLLLEKGCLHTSPWTRRMYRMRGGHLVRLLIDMDVNALTVDDLKSYCQTRTKEHASPETVRKELVTIRRALEVAAEHGHFLGEARTLIPKWTARYIPRRRWLSVDEAKQLLAALPNERHRLWTLIAIYTGARYSEVSSLRWSQIDEKRGAIRLAGTKTRGSDRLIPLPAPLRAVLPERPERDEPIVGAWPKVNRDLRRACERAKIDRVSPNDLRRTYASWLKQRGEDSYVVAQLLGHSSSRMVELVYGRLDHATLAMAVKSLPVDVGQQWARDQRPKRKSRTQRKEGRAGSA